MDVKSFLFGDVMVRSHPKARPLLTVVVSVFPEPPPGGSLTLAPADWGSVWTKRDRGG